MHEFEVDIVANQRGGTDGNGLGHEASSSSLNWPNPNQQRSSWLLADLEKLDSDPILPHLFERIPIECIDRENEAMREKHRPGSLLNFYPASSGSGGGGCGPTSAVETRLCPESPREHTPARLLVKCTHLKFDLEIEPMWASMALYDLKERKKLSENFYFDLNTEPLKQLLQSHQTHEDVSTQAKACIFNITYPSDDLFLVIRVEKCLQQGDIGECAEPYVKAAQSGQSTSQVEKLATNAAQFCERLGKYRMPFVWTAINVMTILSSNQPGANGPTSSEIGTMANVSNSADSNSTATGSGVGGKSASLDRRTGPQAMNQNVSGKNSSSSSGSSSNSSTSYGLKNAYESFRKVRFPIKKNIIFPSSTFYSSFSFWFTLGDYF